MKVSELIDLLIEYRNNTDYDAEVSVCLWTTQGEQSAQYPIEGMSSRSGKEILLHCEEEEE